MGGACSSRRAFKAWASGKEVMSTYLGERGERGRQRENSILRGYVACRKEHWFWNHRDVGSDSNSTIYYLYDLRQVAEPSLASIPSPIKWS